MARTSIIGPEFIVSINDPVMNNAYLNYQKGNSFSELENMRYNTKVRIIGTNIVADYLRANASDQRIKAARSQYRAWAAVTLAALWNVPQDVQKSHPKASVLKNSRVVFNIKGNDYRLVCVLNYQVKLVEIRWFGSHPEYNGIDANSI